MHKASALASEYLKEKPFCNKSHDSPFSFKCAVFGYASSGKADHLDRWGCPLYQYYDEHPVEATRFAKAMEGITRCK